MEETLISPDFTVVFEVRREGEEMLREAGRLSARAGTFDYTEPDSHTAAATGAPNDAPSRRRAPHHGLPHRRPRGVRLDRRQLLGGRRRDAGPGRRVGLWQVADGAVDPAPGRSARTDHGRHGAPRGARPADARRAGDACDPGPRDRP